MRGMSNKALTLKNTDIIIKKEVSICFIVNSFIFQEA